MNQDKLIVHKKSIINSLLFVMAIGFLVPSIASAGYDPGFVDVYCPESPIQAIEEVENIEPTLVISGGEIIIDVDKLWSTYNYKNFAEGLNQNQVAKIQNECDPEFDLASFEEKMKDYGSNYSDREVNDERAMVVIKKNDVWTDREIRSGVKTLEGNDFFEETNFFGKKTTILEDNTFIYVHHGEDSLFRKVSRGLYAILSTAELLLKMIVNPFG